MIIINLDVMMAKRKMSLNELSERVGITIANLSILKNNRAKAIRFSTLDAICRALECQPSDILEFVPDHPLTAGEAEGTIEGTVNAISFTTPKLEDDHQLDLVLEIFITGGEPLTNNSCSWYYIDGGLTMVVG